MKRVFKYSRIINNLPFNNSIRMRNGLLSTSNAVLINSKISGSGTNNNIFIGKNTILSNCKIHILGDNNVIKILSNCVLKNVEIWIEDNNNTVNIKDNTNFSGRSHLACIEGTSITIGSNCLFSSNIVLRTGDSHSILDLNGNRTNYSSSIVIKDHVWVGYDVKINKGVTIPKNSIIATGSVVTKTINEENVVIGGVPANIIKENVQWTAERIKQNIK